MNRLVRLSSAGLTALETDETQSWMLFGTQYRPSTALNTSEVTSLIRVLLGFLKRAVLISIFFKVAESAVLFTV